MICDILMYIRFIKLQKREIFNIINESSQTIYIFSNIKYNSIIFKIQLMYSVSFSNLNLLDEIIVISFLNYKRLLCLNSFVINKKLIKNDIKWYKQ